MVIHPVPLYHWSEWMYWTDCEMIYLVITFPIAAYKCVNTNKQPCQIKWMKKLLAFLSLLHLPLTENIFLSTSLAAGGHSVRWESLPKSWRLFLWLCMNFEIVVWSLKFKCSWECGGETLAFQTNFLSSPQLFLHYLVG